MRGRRGSHNGDDHGDEHDEHGADHEDYDADYDVEDYEDEDGYGDEDGHDDGKRDGRPRPTMTALDAARGALTHILELTGRRPAGVTSLRSGDDGWVAEVEVVEDRRIPSSEDIIGLYRIELDDDGSPLGYERLSRYPRGRGDRREGRA